MNLGTTIRDIRKKRSISQKDLAIESDVSQTYISQIESGKRTPSIETLEKLGVVLEIPYQIISFLSLDEGSVPESKRKEYMHFAPAMKKMVEGFFFTDSEES